MGSGVRAGTTRPIKPLVLALCAALSMTACSSSHQPTPSRSRSPTDPIAAAIAADFNSYTTDDQIRAIIVTVDGRTRFERYYSSSARESRDIFSVTKSVMSALIGLAISEGRLRLNERLSQMLPGYAAEMTPRVARVTLRQLLTMTAGFPDASSTYDIGLVSPPDWVRYILKRQDSPPGKEFHYSNYGVHLLSPILVQATGQSVLAYARTHLFDPLGIPTTPADQPLADKAHLTEYERAGFAWPVDPQGFHTAASDLKLRPQDMVRFGRLFLQGGQWNGRQVVPGSWVRQATTAQAGTAFTAFTPDTTRNFRPTGYGYLWWATTADHAAAFFALGFGGQLIEVVPQRHLVIVISTYVDPKTGNEMVNADDVQRLANAIVTEVRRR
jgi:CubicO group peptidase (beta-lactamase class C family)